MTTERQSFPAFEESDFWLDISAVTMYDLLEFFSLFNHMIVDHKLVKDNFLKFILVNILVIMLQLKNKYDKIKD